MMPDFSELAKFIGGALIAIIYEHLIWPFIRRLIVNPLSDRRRRRSDKQLSNRLDNQTIIINGCKQYLFEFAPSGFAPKRVIGKVTSDEYDIRKYREKSGILEDFPSGLELHDLYLERKRGLEMPDSKLWNGSQLAPKHVVRRRDSEFEEPHLHIELGSRDYANFLVVGETLESLVKSGSCGAFLASAIEQPDPLLATDFGLIINVVTADEKVIVTRRGQAAYSWNDYWHIAVAESVTKQDADIDGDIDFHRVIRRALREELGLEMSLEEVQSRAKIHSLNVHVNRHSWMLFVHLDFRDTVFTFDQIVFLRSLGGGRDHWESKELRPINFDSVSILRELRVNESKWVPFGMWCLLLSAIHCKVVSVNDIQTNLIT
jgi:hypothetical protein